MASIEIQTSNGLQKAYFRLPNRDNLTNTMKGEILYGIERSSLTEKIQDFVDEGTILLHKLEYLAKIKQFFLTKYFFLFFSQKKKKKKKIIRILIDSQDTLYQFFLLLTFAINIIIIATWEANVDPTIITPVVGDWYNVTIIVLGSIHAFLSLILTIGHFVDNPPFDFEVCFLSFFYFFPLLFFLFFFFFFFFFSFFLFLFYFNF